MFARVPLFALAPLVLGSAVPAQAPGHHLSGPVVQLWQNIERADDGPLALGPGRPVAVSADGLTLYDTGSRDPLDREPVLLVRALNVEQGELRWSRVFSTGALHGDEGWALGLSPSGDRLFVAGISRVAPFEPDLILLALDAGSGALLWSTTYDTGQGKGEYPWDLAVSPDGARVVVAAQGQVPGLYGSDALVLAFDAAAGGLVWSSVIHEGFKDIPRRLAFAPDGSQVFVAGELSNDSACGTPYCAPSSDCMLAAFELATGIRRWLAIFDSHTLGGQSNDDRVQDLCVSPDGKTIWTTGLGDGPGLFPVALTMAWSAADGSILWRDATTGPGAPEAAAAHALALAPAGDRLYVAGEAYNVGFTPPPRHDWLVLAYDAATGVPSWAVNHDTGGLDQALDLALSLDGTLICVAGRDGGTGSSSTFTGAVRTTIAYETATGLERWRAGYDGPLSGAEAERAVDVQVAPASGRVLVTGESTGSAPGQAWWGSLAYQLETLSADPSAVSLSLGGRQTLHLDAGAHHAGELYLVLGSARGTAPGFPVGALHVPLVPDPYLTFTLTHPNSPHLPASLGLLDAQGRATTAVLLSSGVHPSLAGLALHHAFATIGVAGPSGALQVSLVSNAVRLCLLP